MRILHWYRPRFKHSFASLTLLLYVLAPFNSGISRAEGQSPTRTEQGTTLKVEAPSVVVDVIVTDGKGNPVGNLGAEQFRVSEDGVPQRIVTFIPPSGAQHAQQPAPARAETRPAATEQEARALASIRFITLVMDIGDLKPESISRATDAAVKYLKTSVAKEDYVAVYWVASTLHLVVPFTQDKAKAAEALEQIGRQTPAGRLTVLQRIQTQQEIEEQNFFAYGLRATTELGGGVIGEDIEVGGGADLAARLFAERRLATLRDYLITQNAWQARAVFAALHALAESYRPIPGRKNVVVFSEGFMHAPEEKDQLQAVIDAANRANVTFYIVDAAGLTAGYTAATGYVEQTPNQEAYQLSLWGPAEITRTGLDKFDWLQHLGMGIGTTGHDDLGLVASATGGFYFKNQNDLQAGLELADRDLRQFYTLVYQTPNTRYDGAFRKISVELVQPDYRVRYRQGYWAIPPGESARMTPAAAQLLAGVTSGSLKPSFTLQLSGAVLLAPNGRLAAPIQVELPATAGRFTKDPKTDSYHSDITLVLVALDAKGHIASAHQRVLDLRFDSQQWAGSGQKKLTIDARLAIQRLEPLTVEAILQFADGTIGRGETRFDIAAAKAGPSLTSLLLTNRVGRPSGTADPSNPLQGADYQIYMLPQPEFAPSDKLTVFFGALNVLQDPSTHRPGLRLRFTIKHGENAARQPASIEAHGTAGQNSLVVMQQFDLSGLSPDDYVVQVEAQDEAGHAVTSRSAGFTVSKGSG